MVACAAMSAGELVRGFGAQTVREALSPLISDARKERIEQVLDARLGSFTLVLENLYDPRNGAAVIRSAEAFGLQRIHVVEGVAGFDANHSVAIGAHKWMDVLRHSSVASAASALRAQGMRLCATVPGAKTELASLDPSVPRALFLGNEHAGLSAEAIAACDETVALPMAGFTQSFNLSVSAALFMSTLVPARRASLRRSGDLPAGEVDELRARWYAQSVRGSRSVVSRFVSKSIRADRVKSPAADL